MPAPSVLPEVELPAGTLLIGDLHLDVSPRGGRHERFAAWAESLSGVPRLVVLGDLFDAWVGPVHARLEPARAVCAALAVLARRGCVLDVLHGNRDFLLEKTFERDSGARVRSDGMLALLPGGARALLVHGDELCTLDRAYQRMKRVLRSPAVAWTAPRLPASAALWVARRLRASSVRAVAGKPPAEKQQQPSAVRELARAHAASLVICGHAHRYRDEALAGGPRWVVVGAFGHGHDLLEITADGGLEARSARLEPDPGGAGP